MKTLMERKEFLAKTKGIEALKNENAYSLHNILNRNDYIQKDEIVKENKNTIIDIPENIIIPQNRLNDNERVKTIDEYLKR